MRNEELEKMCEDSIYSRVTYCQDYGTKDCKMSCRYAKQVTEQLTLYKKGKSFKNKLNFDVKVAGE